jgi:16S rRNA (cytosine1402-N4)-methyltransferase
MAEKCISYLNLRAGKIYVDATTGGGGHSLAMLKSEPSIRLYCFDQDMEAIEEASKKLSNYENVELIKANFQQLRTELAYRKVKGIDGILFDLGVSSHQLNNENRGFSFEKDALWICEWLAAKNIVSYDAVNELDAKELARIFRDYGEELNAYRIAKAIERSPKPVNTTGRINQE